MILWELFWNFFVVSSFTFGGAYGAIPLIRDMVLSNGWLDEETLSYMIAVSESTPGPIMVNLATYVGSNQAGFWGALVATAAVVLPAFLVILLVMGLLKTAIKNQWVQAALRGVKPCVVGIVVATGLYMTVESLQTEGFFCPNFAAVGVLAALLAVLGIYRRKTKKPLSPILLIVTSAVLGILIC